MKIALLQTDIRPHDIEGNLLHHRRLLEQTDMQDVGLLVFPEMFACGFSESLADEAEEMDGQSMRFLQETARTCHTDVIATLPIRDHGLIYNRLVWFTPDRLLGWYDKRHPFFGIEQHVCAPGQRRCVFRKGQWNCLPLTCFDVRFPVWSRNRYAGGRFEYDLLGYTCNFHAPREKTLIALAAARAAENQAYVFVVNRIGRDGYGHAHSGGTAVIGPDGEILQTAPFNREAVLIQDLDYGKLCVFRKSFPVARHWDDAGIPFTRFG